VVVVVLLRRQAFYLYDTLGFPVDLTQLMAVEKGLGVDMQGFAREMEAQKQRSRDAAQRLKAGGAGFAKPLLLQVGLLLGVRGGGVGLMMMTDRRASCVSVEGAVI
jgi:hypothetical protein